VAALVGSGVPLRAADVTPAAPVVTGAAPVFVGEAPGCATCQSGQGGSPKAGCATCGKLFTGGGLFHKTPNPYPVNLCPGACFGYFQTQWRKWDEVCPYPYLGQGVSDAGRLPGAGTRPGGELAPPRPLDPKVSDPKTTDPKAGDPKKTGGSDLPPIPMAPQGNKFGP
jgi:hypothetical protein